MKLIFLDIDGTLVEAGENTPPKSAIEAIKKARENGHKVFLCTGRNMGMAKPVFDLGFDGIISLAGAYIYCDNKAIYDMSMPKEEYDDLINILHSNGVFCTVETKDETFGDENLESFLKDNDETNSEIERWRKALSNELGIKPLSEYDDQDVYKIVVMASKIEQLQEAKDKYEDKYAFVMQEVKEHNNCINGELINRKFDKGKAIIKVAEYYGVDIQDTIGFGDSMNDEPMIKTVGISMCMGNGAKALKEISDYVLDSVSEDGLYKGFKQLGII